MFIPIGKRNNLLSVLMQETKTKALTRSYFSLFYIIDKKKIDDMRCKNIELPVQRNKYNLIIKCHNSLDRITFYYYFFLNLQK